MDKQQELLAKLLQELNLDYSLERYQDRMYLNKVFFLLRSYGVDLGYKFRFVGGDYISRDLLDDISLMRSCYKAEYEDLKNAKLDESLKSKVDRFKKEALGNVAI